MFKTSKPTTYGRIKELLDFNKKQKEYKNHFELYIYISGQANEYIHFNFVPNFPFSANYKDKLEEITSSTTKTLAGELCGCSLIYLSNMHALAEYLNPFDIGIILNSKVETELKPITDRYMLQDFYSTYYSSYDSNTPESDKLSYQDWYNKIWNGDNK